jgi:hydroxymethylpyrimidine/phosphomethylpyrimidine kinase
MAATVRGAADTPRVLSIAGSDSGGGAGVQADLKAFARCGVHGMTALTAVTAQSTVGVNAIHSVPPGVVLAQVRAVVGDIGVDAVKVGMLGTAEVTLAVARALDELPASVPIVVDPVMVAESGARLLEAAAEEALVREILPRATVLTPNLPEARVLVRARGSASCDTDASASRDTGGSVPRDTDASTSRDTGGFAFGDTDLPSPDEDEDAEAEALARAVLELGPRIVVLTGGHRARVVDLFLDASPDDGEIVEIAGERYGDGAAHGSGCTHSALLAARLALGATPLEAARVARALTGEAVANGLRDIGAGPGPVDVLGLARIRASPNMGL